MRLSEAMKLGAMLKPQIHTGEMRGPVSLPSQYGDVFGLRVTEGTCALGAAEDAGFGDIWSSPLRRIAASCPVCYWGHDCGFLGVVWHLNDTHHWTREQIADFVAVLEQRHEAATAADAVGQPVRTPTSPVREKVLSL